LSADGAIQDGRIVAIGEVGKDAPGIVDAGGLALMPGIDLHTHYDAQVTWDPLSPSPSLGVTTAVMGNCGFGKRAVTFTSARSDHAQSGCREGMDLDALRAGIDWRFQSFAEYMTMLRRRGPYMNLGVLVGHSAVRTAVMGDDASVRKAPTAAEIAEMKRQVAEAMDQGAIGIGASYSLNHSG
jgi:N-acyl-D-amino-acid deacylase